MPGDSALTRSPGAGHGEVGDAPLQGPAQERKEPLSEQPEPANLETAIFKAVAREGAGLVMTRPKPEKRKNAKERAKDKHAKEKTTEDGTTPAMTATAKSKVDAKAKKKAESKARRESKAKKTKAAPRAA